jgi:hypothetical protein
VRFSELFDSSSVVDGTVPSDTVVTKSIAENVESNVCSGFEN